MATTNEIESYRKLQKGKGFIYSRGLPYLGERVKKCKRSGAPKGKLIQVHKRMNRERESKKGKGEHKMKTKLGVS